MSYRASIPQPNVSYAGIPSVTMGTTVTATSGATLSYLMYQADAGTGNGVGVMVPGDDVVGYNIEDAYGKDEEFHEALVKIRCPHCAYPNYPFRKRERPKCLETGEEWVGIDYKQPYAHYSTECSYCHEVFYMRLFAPQ